MRDDSVDNSLLFVFWNSIDVAGAVELGLTSTFPLGPVEHLVDVHALSTAFVFVSANCAQPHFGSGGLRMKATVTHLCDRVVVLTAIAPNKIKVGPDFPVNFFPRYTVSLSYEGYELLQVPVAVNDVLSPHLAICINQLVPCPAAEYLALLL